MVAEETKTVERYNGTTQVTVNMINVNDEGPKFSDESYSAQIPENSPKNTFVMQITATDIDDGIFGEISYVLRGASADL